MGHHAKATPEPAGGRITRYADGRLNGELVDAAKALVRLPPSVPRTPDQQLEDRVADYKKLNEAGLTTIRHPGISIAEYRMLQEMQKRGQLTIRVNALLRPAIGPGGIDPPLAAVRASSRTRATSGCASAASSSPSTAASKAA